MRHCFQISNAQCAACFTKKYLWIHKNPGLKCHRKFFWSHSFGDPCCITAVGHCKWSYKLKGIHPACSISPEPAGLALITAQFWLAHTHKQVKVSHCTWWERSRLPSKCKEVITYSHRRQQALNVGLPTARMVWIFSLEILSLISFMLQTALKSPDQISYRLCL